TGPSNGRLAPRHRRADSTGSSSPGAQRLAHRSGPRPDEPGSHRRLDNTPSADRGPHIPLGIRHHRSEGEELTMVLAHDVAGETPGNTQGLDIPVLLLHSTVCDRRMWDHQVITLTNAGYRVIRCDLSGYGQS